MAVGDQVAYPQYGVNLLTATHVIDFSVGWARMALVQGTYTPSAAHAVWSDVSAHELAAGGGYAVGGAPLTTSVALNTDTGKAEVRCAPPSWVFTASKSFRWGVVYGNLAASKPLVSYVDLGSQTVTGGFSVALPTGVLWDL
jgi:hypothetical protein